MGVLAHSAPRRVSGPWALTVKNLLFPQFCRQCGSRLLTEENGYFCPACWEASPRITRPFCTCCGRPHQSMVGLGARANFPCADCRARPPRHVGRIYGAAVYDGPLGEAVRLLKFQGKRRLAGPIGEVMAGFAEQEMDIAGYDLLVPVPLHTVRARARGFNQSALLAAEIAPRFAGARISEALHRIRPTRTQSKLHGEEERRANVRGAFAALGEGFHGKRVLLIDDVVTTAVTVSECAAALRRAGAQEVDVFAATLAVVSPQRALLARILATGSAALLDFRHELGDKR